jgi:signal transduction histidine kinase
VSVKTYFAAPERARPAEIRRQHQKLSEVHTLSNVLSAENGTLEVQKNLISPGELIDHVVRLFVHDELAEGKHIEIAPFSESLSFINDESTLRRVLVNAVKNALGTYSMKLLTEEYLGGQVSFRSSEQEGTTFIFVIPNRGAG